jgi:hypothetical protein
MVRVDGDVLFLEDEHGEPKSVPLSRLSRADQAYVRQESSVTKPAAVDR